MTCLLSVILLSLFNFQLNIEKLFFKMSDLNSDSDDTNSYQQGPQLLELVAVRGSLSQKLHSHCGRKKHYDCWRMQTKLGENLRIMDIVARWPGSTHDSTIFNASALHLRFIQGEFSNCFLLADNAYQQKKFILTPILNPQDVAQVRYNAAHVKTRNCIEQCFGVFKRRFPVLALGFRTKTETTLAAIVAAAVLHNMAIEEKEDVPAVEMEADYDDPV
ncbi:hypothetical protein C0J52_23385 [Blattella germanica]|nr:hypothetical protein C0J52_23385 [Blattella germanica]